MAAAAKRVVSSRGAATVRVKAPKGSDLPALEFTVPERFVPSAETFDRVFDRARKYVAPAVGAVFLGVSLVAAVIEARERHNQQGRGSDDE